MSKMQTENSFNIHKNKNNNDNSVDNMTISPKPKSLNNPELMKFISSGIKSKMSFTSAFDHKGSKNFIEAKKIALQEILVLDDNIDNIEEKEALNYKTKNTKIFKMEELSIANTQKKHLTPETSLTKIQNENTKSNKNKSQNKRERGKVRKPKTKKNLWRYKIKDFDDELNKDKDKKSNKKKIFKSHEIEMFKDKKIKLLEPIKNPKNNEKDKTNYNFVKKNSEENDLSLFDLVNQL